MDNTIYRNHLERQEVNNLLKKHNRRIKEVTSDQSIRVVREFPVHPILADNPKRDLMLETKYT
jgi:hypothetical protein